MIESTRPKLNRFKYTAMLFSALAVAAVPPAGLTAIAAAADEWDIGAYDRCIADNGDDILSQHLCCDHSGGVWIPRKLGDNNSGKCVAPPANPASSQPQGPNRGPRSAPPTAINPAP
jgi:hypothetical protein